MSHPVRGIAALATIALIATSVWSSSPRASTTGPGSWMGVRVVPLSDGWREQYSYSRAGVRVIEVEPDGAADRIGIVPGDILVNVGSVPLRRESDLATAESRSDLSAPVPVVIARYNGSLVKIRNMEFVPPVPETKIESAPESAMDATKDATKDATAGAPPEVILGGASAAAVAAEPKQDPLAQLGIQCVNLNHDLATVLGASKDEGVLVLQVASGGKAEGFGIRAGDVISSAADKPVGNAEALAGALAASPSGITLHVLRRSDERDVTVSLVAPPAPAPKEITKEEAVEQELRELRQELEALRAEIAAKKTQD